MSKTETGVLTAMTLQVATAYIIGETPLLFGKQIDQERIPKEPKETHDTYEKRTWRERVHSNKDGNLFVPARAFKKLLENTAGYQNERIAGQGMKTWKAKFRSGISVENDMLVLVGGKPVAKETVEGITQSVPSDGRPGGAKRVKRTFPIIAPPWQGSIRILLLDPFVQKDKVEEYLRFGGVINGLGMWRPQNGGNYGRYSVDKIEWDEIKF